MLWLRSKYMPLTSDIKHIFEPDNLQCGQAVIAMLTGRSIEEVISVVGTKRETTLNQMFNAFDFYGISYNKERISVNKKEELPSVCLLSLETPRCWHWSLFYKGKFYDPEHGVLDDFPISYRKYFWEIKE